jgi:hypothetical protein
VYLKGTPFPPVNTTVGADVYPVAAADTVILVTDAERTVVAVDIVVLAPVNTTVVADLYPLPPFVTVIEFTTELGQYILKTYVIFEYRL